MADQDVAEILRQNPWFQALGSSHFQKLIDIASEANWNEGEIIFKEGDKDAHLYLILEGRIALEKYIPGKGRVTILTLGSAEIFGWSAVTPVVETRTASARAVSPSRAIAFDTRALRKICEEDHELGYYVYRRLTNVIAGRLTGTRLQLLDMYAGSRE